MGTSGLGMAVRLRTEGDALVIEVHGVLDEVAARTLGAAVRGAVQHGWKRLHVDLGNVLAYTDGGVTAFARLRSGFPIETRKGLTYQAGSETGQDALLATYTRQM